MVGRTGFEPVKALPTDLQSVPFGHSGTSPRKLFQQSPIPLFTRDSENYHSYFTKDFNFFRKKN